MPERGGGAEGIIIFLHFSVHVVTKSGAYSISGVSILFSFYQPPFLLIFTFASRILPLHGSRPIASGIAMAVRSTPVLDIFLAKKQGSSQHTLLFGTNSFDFQEPRFKMVRGYGFSIIAVGNVRFWRTSVYYSLVYGSKRSLRFGSVRLQSGYELNNTSLPKLGHLPCLHLYRHVFAASCQLSPTFRHRPSLQHILDALAESSLLSRDEGLIALVYLEHLNLPHLKWTRACRQGANENIRE